MSRPAVLRAIVQALGALPPWAQRVLGGRHPVVDGQRLYPEAGLAVRLLNLLPQRDFGGIDVARFRRETTDLAWAFAASTDVDTVEDLAIPAEPGPVPARRYVGRADATPAGALVYFHGGDWIAGGLDSADSICRYLAREANVVVLSVDYRLAPEHPFPAGVHDALAAYRWARGTCGTWGVDADRVAVGGDSAGANLATVVSLQTPAAERPAAQVLFYPPTDLSTRRPSYRLFGTGYFLTVAEVDWAKGRYLGDADPRDPRASPLLADDLSGQPFTYLALAGFDVLRDEGIAYGERLRAAGTDVVVRVHEGLIHGFANASGFGRASTAAVREAAVALAGALTQGRRG